jgi:cobalt-zinc-cadmium efflux system outer membrane protein
MLRKQIDSKYLLIPCLVLLAVGVAKGQSDTTFQKKPVLYRAFIETVGKNNVAYAAEKFSVNISEANIESAKIFPDPELTAGWFDNGQRRLNMGYGYSAELGWLLELGGKRKARINLAKSEAELTKYLLQDYFRNLRADATTRYLEAIQNEQLVNVQLNSYDAMTQLAKSDSIRAKLGSITEVDARQSKLEAGTMLNDVFQAIANWKASLSNLTLLMGAKQSDTLTATIGGFAAFDRKFTLPELIITAQNNRSDLMAALQNKDVSKKMLQLAKANRVIDLGLTGGMTYSSYVRNIIAPTPSFTQTGVGISIPLKFSNNRQGELKAAYYTTLQSEAQYRQVELQVQTEVTQAYFNYQAAQKQVQQFNTGLLTEAKIILDGKVYSYRRGETTLLEVLNAQRTYNEVQQNYYQTLFNYAAALVELERAAGIWDINF